MLQTNDLAYLTGVSVTEKKVYNIATRAQYYKTYYVRNLQKFVIS